MRQSEKEKVRSRKENTKKTTWQDAKSAASGAGAFAGSSKWQMSQGCGVDDTKEGSSDAAE